MRRAVRAAGLVLAFAACPLCAAEPGGVPDTAISAAATGYWYAMRDQPDFGVGVATLDRGALHLEARYNYEARDSASLFAGWKLSGGEELAWSATPILGGLFGAAHGIVPGLEATVAWKSLDLYVEAEYVRDMDDAAASYFYAWSELGWTPASWLRVGLVGQRTRTIDNGRDLQRGVFAQLVFDKATLGAYWFNPDDAARYVIAAFGLRF